ncbi:MAG TPA: hypothetical protein VNZ55_03740, partial [Thermomicrobiales bacterium]|nr:hypothetical protein [Thermomicrobiales bacterium]
MGESLDMRRDHFAIMRWLMTAGLLAGTWAVITTPAPVAGQDNLASAAPLDLAAMALNPLDLAAFGLQPYG